MNKPSHCYPMPRFKQRIAIPGCSYNIICSQFPLQLAYAVTVHRMQGMTVQKAILKKWAVFLPQVKCTLLSVELDAWRTWSSGVTAEWPSIYIDQFYEELLAWCDYVDAIQPTPPTTIVPYPERADDVSNAPLHTNEDKSCPDGAKNPTAVLNLQEPATTFLQARQYPTFVQMQTC